MRYLSVCSGIEAASVAWHHLGWEPVAFSEIEPFPAAVLKHRFPNVPNYGDMTKHKEWPLEPGSVDLLVGGTPCQSFSVAGLRKGLHDPRGGLMLTYLEIAQRLRPRWVVWENVPGVLSSGGGRDFGSFLGALGELRYGWAYRVIDAQYCRVDGRWPKAVPQRRRRVFVVGCDLERDPGGRERAAEVLALGTGLRWHLAESGKTRKAAPSDAEAGVGAGCWWDGGGCAGTLTKQNAGGAQRMPDKDNFGAVLQPVGFCWQNNDLNLKQDSVTAALRSSAGSSDFHEMNHPVVVPQPVPIQDGREIQKAQNGIGVGDQGDPAYTLDTTGAQAVGQPIPFTKSKRAQSVTDDETRVDGQVNPTLSLFDQGDTRATTVAVGTDLYNGTITGNVAATMGTPGSSVNASGPTVMAAVAFPINTLTLGGRPDAVNDNRMTMGVGENGDPQFTLQAAHGHAVAHAFYSTGGTHGVNQQPEVSPAVKVGSGLGIPSPPAVAFTRCDNGGDASVEVTPTMRCGSNYSAHPAVAFSDTSATLKGGSGERGYPDPSDGNGHSMVGTAMTVRRLTPRECERLQGFPDDYTLIPWRKKEAADCPDGPRYKALGNSMAVNCMEWIGERIHAYEQTGRVAPAAAEAELMERGGSGTNEGGA